jgi:hypothetical protein
VGESKSGNASAAKARYQHVVIARS